MAELPPDVLARIEAARVGVLAFRAGDEPRACAVTPLVDGGHPVVTSTLAYPAKMEHLRADPRVALLAGGVRVSGRAEVSADLDGERVAGTLLDQEGRKYPPTRRLRGVPGHRRLFPWYFGRVVADILVDAWEVDVERTDGEPATAGDARTVTTLDVAGFPRIDLLPDGADLAAEAFPLAVPDGPAVVLEHRESDDGARLAQLTLRGKVAGAELRVAARQGSAEVPPAQSLLAQLRELRAMARRGRAGRERVAGWT